MPRLPNQDRDANAYGPRAGSGRAEIGRRALVMAGLAVALLCAMFVSLCIGEVAISPSQVVDILLRHLGWVKPESVDGIQDGVLWSLRLPRVLLGALVGCCLGLAGAVLQGLLRNPLADPAVLGGSAGASLGTVLMLLIGGSGLGMAVMLPAAAIGSLAATGTVYLLAVDQGRADILTMVLAGIAVNAIVAGVIGLLIAATNNTALNSVTFWELGSLSGATWNEVLVAAPIALAGLLFLSRWARVLDLLSIGERDAHYLGVPVARTRLILLAVASLLTAVTVAVAGMIGFVGLIVPHLMRLLLGPDHGAILPACALAGALLVVLVDLAARTAAAPAEVPLGSLTALLGCPFFLWLLRHNRALRGQWT